jgi:hypothetical protein
VPPSLTLLGSGSGGSSSSSSSSTWARSTTTPRRRRCSARELPATRRWPNPRARLPGGALDGGQCTAPTESGTGTESADASRLPGGALDGGQCTAPTESGTGTESADASRLPRGVLDGGQCTAPTESGTGTESADASTYGALTRVVQAATSLLATRGAQVHRNDMPPDDLRIRLRDMPCTAGNLRCMFHSFSNASICITQGRTHLRTGEQARIALPVCVAH